MSAKILTLKEIKPAINIALLEQAVEDAFIAYSHKRTVAPPPTHLGIDEHSGECHIKCGYIIGSQYFVVKAATGFPKNILNELPTGHGVLLIFNAKTGLLEAVLLDEGYLTDLRTAIAGRIAAKYFAPKNVECIGIIGTGVQARLQLELLQGIVNCNKVQVWGRTPVHTTKFKNDMSALGFDIEACELPDVACNSNLIITTTASCDPLIQGAWIKPGTHITAMGADGAGKHELATNVFQKAGIVIADSISQCAELGDISFALKDGVINREAIVELGQAIAQPNRYARRDEHQITVADLTGLGVQDAAAACCVYTNYLEQAANLVTIPDCENPNKQNECKAVESFSG